MDAIIEAGKLGIAADRAQNYTADAVGTVTAWTSMAAGACIGVRTGKGLAGWCDSIKSGVSKSSGSTGAT